jgi:hypothetical protein
MSNNDLLSIDAFVCTETEERSERRIFESALRLVILTRDGKSFRIFKSTGTARPKIVPASCTVFKRNVEDHSRKILIILVIRKWLYKMEFLKVM